MNVCMYVCMNECMNVCMYVSTSRERFSARRVMAVDTLWVTNCGRLNDNVSVRMYVCMYVCGVIDYVWVYLGENWQ